MKKTLLVSIFSTVLVISACSSSNTNDVPKPKPNADDGEPDSLPAVVAFEKIACNTLVPDEFLEKGVLGDNTTECGFVTVPADWSAPDGDAIKVAVYRIPSTSDAAAAVPIVYLEGGPGGAGVQTVAEFSSGSARSFRERSDVYVIDQRGTGFSQPALYCPEVNALEDHSISAVNAAHQSCHDRLVGEGVRFADYSSANNARDVDATRRALNIESWDIYGVSYGTRLALTIMRDRPSGIRAVILDSVFPPEINGVVETPYTYYWAIEQITTNCAADADCVEFVGDIKVKIEDAIARLDVAPIGFLDAQEFIAILGDNIANEELAAMVLIIAEGTDEEVQQLLADLLSADEENQDTAGDGDDSQIQGQELPQEAELALNAEAFGMGYAIICAEETQFPNATASPDIAGEFRESTQRIIDAVERPFNPALCDIYNVPTANEIETKAVQSTIPTLILAGAADIATPPTWATLADESLANSQYAEFDGLTHGLLSEHECVTSITLAFLANPENVADQSCINSLPRVDYVTGQ